jgi:hypothetical protein
VTVEAEELLDLVRCDVTEAITKWANRCAVAYSLIELMAMHIPRDDMPDGERRLLDDLLGAPNGHD